MFYCTGKHIESGYVTVPVIAEGRENFSNFDLMLAFGPEISEGENRSQNKPNSKQTNENKSVEEDGSSKKRRLAVTERS